MISNRAGASVATGLLLGLVKATGMSTCMLLLPCCVHPVLQMLAELVWKT
jgi:hypothetical protein